MKFPQSMPHFHGATPPPTSIGSDIPAPEALHMGSRDDSHTHTRSVPAIFPARPILKRDIQILRPDLKPELLRFPRFRFSEHGSPPR
jgi:hypothetical protein